MDLIKFQKHFPRYLQLLEENNFSVDYIRLVKRVGKIIEEHGNSPSVSSFEDIYFSIRDQKTFADSHLVRIKNAIGRIKVFVEEGEFLGLSTKKTKFLTVHSYDKLDGEYKKLIDTYYTIERERGFLKESSIHRNACCTASFLAYFAERGYHSFNEICDQQLINDAFAVGQKRHNSAYVARIISRVFSRCSTFFPDCICDKISMLLPEYPRRKKLYQYLNKQENTKVKQALNSTNMSLRDKAICALAYYTGLRGSDIAKLKFEDVDIVNDEIKVFQQKTGDIVRIPLRGVVGNALYDYIVKERPKSQIDEIFLMRKTHVIAPINAGMMYKITGTLYDIAGIRTELDDTRGGHLLRHNFATDLISQNTPHNIVSELLGHKSLDSIKPYLDADIENLRAFSLDISIYQSVGTPVLINYVSVLSEELRKFRDMKIKNNQWDWCSNMSLFSLDSYFHAIKLEKTERCIKESLIEWWTPLKDESYLEHTRRIVVVNDFITSLNTYNSYNIPCLSQSSISKKKKFSYSNAFLSNYHVLFEEFVDYRITSGKWPKHYDKNLHAFDDFCYKQSTGTELSQDIISWCKKRSTESVDSYKSRVSVVNTFIKFVNKRHQLNLNLIEVPKRRFNNTPINPPHSFTEIELQNFFYAASQIQVFHKKSIRETLHKITIPVIFLLAYSSGMRTIELRCLNRKDVNLKDGIINIHNTKGYVEHRVGLHPSMLKVLYDYDCQMDRIIPDRKCFFANEKDNYYSLSWMDYDFNQLWYMYNVNDAKPYDFRHHYATTNINSFVPISDDFYKQLLYLSKSMGHSSIEQTMYYYSFSPGLYNVIQLQKSKSFNLVTSRI